MFVYFAVYIIYYFIFCSFYLQIRDVVMLRIFSFCEGVCLLQAFFSFVRTCHVKENSIFDLSSS